VTYKRAGQNLSVILIRLFRERSTSLTKSLSSRSTGSTATMIRTCDVWQILAAETLLEYCQSHVWEALSNVGHLLLHYRRPALPLDDSEDQSGGRREKKGKPKSEVELRALCNA
jgi:hypothetical protein